MRLVIDLLSSGWKRVVFWLKNVNVLAFIAEAGAALFLFLWRTVPERLHRRENESWDLWLQRVEPALTAEAFAELHAWIEGYQRLRYRTRLDASVAQEWLTRVRSAGRTSAATATTAPK